MLKKLRFISILTLALTTLISANEFMDATWAKKMCKAWNKDATLTTELSEWASNDKNRGYKLIQMYRTQCTQSSKVQLNITQKQNKAVCVYGGKPDGKKVDTDVDYIMHADDDDWTCMGEGSFWCAAMGAMTTGKLKFSGPQFEAMGVMGPFNAFLQLTGKVSGNKGKTCPK
jgi:putative sterol carrier protein